MAGDIAFSTLVLISAALAFIVILWIILPFAVFAIKNTQKDTAESIRAMQIDLGKMAADIAKMTEIQEKEHKLKMIAKKAREAKSST